MVYHPRALQSKHALYCIVILLYAQFYYKEKENKSNAHKSHQANQGRSVHIIIIIIIIIIVVRLKSELNEIRNHLTQSRFKKKQK